MNNRNRITAFYLEAILLIVVFMSIIVVLTNIFGGSRAISSSAKHLNDAVCLAENAACAVSAATSPEEAAGLLDEGGNTQSLDDGTDAAFCARYDNSMKPSPDGPYRVLVSWEPEEAGAGGRLVDSVISVYYGDSDTSLFDLKTSVFIPGRG